MTKILIALSLAFPITLAVALSTGCQSADADTAEVVLCGDCGVEKGAEGCCDADAPRCDDCDMIKGSEGCCK